MVSEGLPNQTKRWKGHSHFSQSFVKEMWPSPSLTGTPTVPVVLATSPVLSGPGSGVQGRAGGRSRAHLSGFSPGSFAPLTFSGTVKEVHPRGSAQVPFHPENLWSLRRRDPWGRLLDFCFFARGEVGRRGRHGGTWHVERTCHMMCIGTSLI